MDSKVEGMKEDTNYLTLGLEVFINSSGEVFVRHKKSRVTLRISCIGKDNLSVTASGARLGPGSINGLEAFIARPS